MAWIVAGLVVVILGAGYVFGSTRTRQIRTEIQIAAPPDVVWQVLTDFRSYKDWNPFIQSLVGAAAVGEIVATKMHPLHQDKSQSFKVTVLVADRERELRWLGSMGLPAIMGGEQFFQLEEVDIEGACGTRFLNNENFTGILLLFFNVDDSISSFDAMNMALKERAEKIAAQP
jgi:hypothetical protein